MAANTVSPATSFKVFAGLVAVISLSATAFLHLNTKGCFADRDPPVASPSTAGGRILAAKDALFDAGVTARGNEQDPYLVQARQQYGNTIRAEYARAHKFTSSSQVLAADLDKLERGISDTFARAAADAASANAQTSRGWFLGLGGDGKPLTGQARIDELRKVRAVFRADSSENFLGAPLRDEVAEASGRSFVRACEKYW